MNLKRFVEAFERERQRNGRETAIEVLLNLKCGESGDYG